MILHFNFRICLPTKYSKAIIRSTLIILTLNLDSVDLSKAFEIIVKEPALARIFNFCFNKNIIIVSVIDLLLLMVLPASSHATDSHTVPSLNLRRSHLSPQNSLNSSA